MPGVNISVLSPIGIPVPGEGTTTDIDGIGELNVDPGTELLITFIGYEDVILRTNPDMMFGDNEYLITDIGMDDKSYGVGVAEIIGFQDKKDWAFLVLIAVLAIGVGVFGYKALN